MPTLHNLLTLLTFLYIIINTEPSYHQKATILRYHATVVWMCPVKFKNYFCCRGRQKYFPDEKIPLSLNSFCVSGSLIWAAHELEKTTTTLQPLRYGPQYRHLL